MESQGTSQMRAVKKISFFQIAKCVFFHFSLFWPLLFSNHITFFFKFILNNLKCYRSTTWSFTNHLGSLLVTESFGCFEPAFVVFSGFFFEFLTPFILGVITFSLLIRFRQLLVCQMCQEEGFKFCLDTRSNGALPFDPACPECLSVRPQPVYPIVSRQSVQNIMSKMAAYLFIRSGFSKKIRKKE